MSSPNSRGFSLSPVQRRACVVLVCCVLAVVASFIGAWVILPMLLSAGSDEAVYDPALYPIDTSSAALLPAGPESNDYMSGTVFVGDQNIAALQRLNLLSLDQFVGADGLSLSNLLREQCVYFVDDAASYTVPQSVVKMKPRRLVLALGTNDAAQNKDVSGFVADYRQAAKAIAGAYSYCDIIVCAVPPVAEAANGSVELQTRIDQYNQALVTMCGEEGYRFLNTSEVLKGADGFAEKSYLDGSGTLNAAGGNAFLMYFRQHPLASQDRRPDTGDIPRRAAQPAGAEPSAEPTPTPTPLRAVYAVDDVSHGTLQTAFGGGQSGVARLELQVPAEVTAEEQKVVVEAVAAQGWSFSKWSDGVTANPRTDVVSKDISVTAIFADARVGVTLDRGDATINIGDTITVTASVTLGGEPCTDGSLMQWIVNDDYPVANDAYDYTENGFTFTFTPKQAGSYVIRGGAEINGGQDSKQFTVTVNAPQSLSISANTTSAYTGDSISLTATKQNLGGTVEWHCDQTVGGWTWAPTGDTAAFSSDNTGSFRIYATCDGVTSNSIDITVNARPAPDPTPDTSEDGDEGGGE